MKKLMLGMVFASAALLANYEIIDFTDFSEKMISDFFTGKAPKNVVLKLSKGSQIPFEISFSGGLISLEGDCDYTIQALKNIFVKFDNDLLFSTDLKKWKPQTQFFTGELKTLIQMYEEDSPGIRLNLELNLK